MSLFFSVQIAVFMSFKAFLVSLCGVLALVDIAWADSTILVQSTTSTRNSGFYDYILPLVKDELGISVKVVAVGTGAALKNAMNCDADVLLVHSRKREDRFVADGYASHRHDLMYNDYVIVGPESDPAGLTSNGDVALAMQKIAAAKAKFVSRGDDSGTHGKEKALWQASGIDPVATGKHWYREAGSGMGETLNLAVGIGAYTLSDRASWEAFANKAGFQILLQGDKRLFNPYGVMLVSKAKCPSVNSDAGQAFIDWLVSPRGQAAIGKFRVGGKQLFFPNAK